MTDRTFLPTDEDVIAAARATKHTPEYVADAMNGPLAAKASGSISATMDRSALEAAADALLERHVPPFGEAIMDAMMTGYKLGFAHGVRSLHAADPVSGLADAIRHAATMRPTSDVRPHVPDDYGDPRIHLIVDGVTACGVPVTVSGRKGTHTVGEQDCHGCTEALRRAGDEAGLPGEAQAVGLVQRAAVGAARGDLAAAEELARAYHPSLFEELADGIGPERLAAAVADQLDSEREATPPEPCPYGYPLGGRWPRVDWCRHEAGHGGGHMGAEGWKFWGTAGAVRRGTPEARFADRSLGARAARASDLADVEERRIAAVMEDQHTVVAPEGWARIEGGGERVEDDRPLTRTVRDDDLIDMTQDVVADAITHDLRWWQCRHCGRGRVMGPIRVTSVRVEGAECAAHEAHCEHAGAHGD